MLQCGVQCIFSIAIVGFLWGATNPLIRSASKTQSRRESDNDNITIIPIILSFFKSFLDWKFSIPFALNQCGSILFNVLVVQFPVTAVVPCVNAIQFISTYVVGWIMGEEMKSVSAKQNLGLALSLTAIIGMLCINWLFSRDKLFLRYVFIGLLTFYPHRKRKHWENAIIKNSISWRRNFIEISFESLVPFVSLSFCNILDYVFILWCC